MIVLFGQCSFMNFFYISFGGISLSHCIFMIAGSNPGNSPLFNISSSMPTAPVRKSGADEFLNSENNKNDYDWYVMAFNFHYPYILFIIFFLTLCLLEQ